MRLMRLLPLFVLLLCSVAQAGADAPFLWEVQGTKARHYLMGSVHMLPDTAYPLPEALESAYQITRTVVFESKLTELAAPELQGRMLGAAKDDRPGGLQAQIGKPLYRQLQKRAQALGMPTPVCEGFRAWFCALTLELFAMQQAGFNAERGVDQYFYTRTLDDGRPVVGLESTQQQLDLFSGMPDALAKRLLAATLDESTTTGQAPEELHRMWRSGDLAALEKRVRRLRQQYPEVYARLLGDRNRAWMPKLIEHLSGAEPQLVIVGAAHFAGVDGLLSLLKAQGLNPQLVTGVIEKDAGLPALAPDAASAPQRQEETGRAQP